MTSEPGEDAIADFVVITNETRDKAIAFLKANNLDSNRAIDAYFENPNGPAAPVPQTWATVSSAPQESYEYQNENMITGFDDSSRYSVAPSRPPSRTGVRELHEGVNIAEAAEMSAEPSVPKTHQMTTAEREDHEMRRALAMSLSDNPNHFGQETGVVSANVPNFGPANRDYYDEQNWALTLPFANVREVCVDPDPEERKRINGQPVFLRPAEEPDHLSALLTILHAIPMARELLLLRNRVAEDYGYDPKWWDGQGISIPSQELPTGNAGSQPSSKDEIILETQRLMAFLDGTKRAFGSAATVSGVRTIRTWSAEKRIEKFLESWEMKTAADRPDDQPSVLFLNRIIQKSDPMDEEPIEKSFMLADLSVDSSRPETLYDVFDENLWADIPDKELDDIWLDHIADVFTVRLTASASNDGVGVKIPAVWYPDRYMESCIEYARELRKRKLDTEAEVGKLQKLIDRISNGEGAGNGAVKFREMMEKTIAGSRVATKGQEPSGSLEDGQEFTSATKESLDQFASQLRAIADQIEQKLTALERRKEEARESLIAFSRQLTSRSESPEEPPHRRYTLRGVCTLPHVMYLLKRREAQANDTDTTMEEDEWQWWRISFSVDDAAARLAEMNQQPAVPSSVGGQSWPDRQVKKRRISVPSDTDVLGYTTRPVREIEVLRAAKEESSTAILVYASDEAVNYKEDVLPPSLQAFVDADNEVFEQDLEDAVRKQQEKLVEMENITPDSPQFDVQPTLVDPFESTEPKMGYTSQDVEIEERGRPLDRLTTTVTESAVPDHPAHRDSPMPEMQEKRGPGLIASTSSRHRGHGSSSGPMELIQEEENGSDTGPTKVNGPGGPTIAPSTT